MRRLVGFLAAAAIIVVSAASNAQANTIALDLSNSTGAQVTFTGGGNFSFTNCLGCSDFGVTDESGFLTAGLVLGKTGNISGGFQIGTPTGSSAPVTGTGVFALNDGAGFALTADIVFNDIQQLGALGGLNSILANVNLSNFAYSGSNASFLQILSSQNPVVVVSLQWTSIHTLTQLRNGCVGTSVPCSTSWSGSFAADTAAPPPPVPEPASMLLLGTGLIGVAGLARRRAKARQTQN